MMQAIKPLSLHRQPQEHSGRMIQLSSELIQLSLDQATKTLHAQMEMFGLSAQILQLQQTAMVVLAINTLELPVISFQTDL
jgi:hypothetical protein